MLWLEDDETDRRVNASALGTVNSYGKLVPVDTSAFGTPGTGETLHEILVELEARITALEP